ncbi:MAG: Nif3-like dinuclear metal center hexameric protein [Desulfovibrio sp.]|jgi:dinuclear metal center YbgI/SA1388 family protein|nr:Nif3-like dinuclear metal center hexameric protein [Desulfovibrio sp.]
MKAVELIAAIERLAPPAAAAVWDVSGVQVASRRERVSRLAVLLDPTLPALSAAVSDGADFILAHHPLALHPRFPDAPGEFTDILALLLGGGIWLYSAHTSLDANPEGPAQWLAQDLALTDLRLLEPFPDGRHGFGFAGLLPSPLAWVDFRDLLRRLLRQPRWRSCGARPETVRSVACCPGAGEQLISAARAAGAEVFITGDVKYHAALEASGRPPHVLDVGHFRLEEEMMSRLAARLQEDLSLTVAFYPGQDPFTFS